MSQIERYQELKERLASVQANLDKLLGQQEMIEANLKKEFDLTPDKAPAHLEGLKKKIQEAEKALKKKLDAVEEALNGLDGENE